MNLSDFALSHAIKRREKEQKAQARRKEREANKKENAMADQANETPVVATPAPAQAPMSYEQVSDMLRLVLAENRELVKEAIAEMKKPTAEEQEKRDKEKAKELKMVQARIEVGKAELERRIGRQRTCAHKRPDGSWAASGQEFSDGTAKILCLQCQKFLYDGPSNPMFKQGVGVNIQLHNVA